MTTKPTALAQALARHKTAQAALDASDDCPDHLCRDDVDALDELAFTPCASDAEFLEKLRYLLAHETRIFGGPPDGPVLIL
jgi:hypothetical protein